MREGKKPGIRKRDEQIGILTFHCADNYGAMLQAYGLKTWLRGHGFDAGIVPYAPFYMIRRHWLIQLPDLRGKNLVRRVRGSIGQTWRNMQILPELLRQRKRMRDFRREELDVSGLPMRWIWQFRFRKYRVYIVGSDQVWNPAITFGLRRAYFGAVPGKREKVISYAASLGMPELLPEYQDEFARLVRNVDLISVREEDSAAFVEKMSAKQVYAMPDPALLLTKKQWEEAQAPCPLPDGFRYILYHATEARREMADYARELAAARGIKVIQICYRKGECIPGFQPILTAGPGEFLTYIHRAEYVVSNSFHGLAISIQFKKPFTAFTYSRSGIRIQELLKLSGLTDRFYNGDGAGIAQTPIPWDAVEANISRAAKRAEDFLCAGLKGFADREGRQG